VSFFIFEFVIGSFSFKTLKMGVFSESLVLDNNTTLSATKTLPTNVQHNTFLEVV